MKSEALVREAQILAVLLLNGLRAHIGDQGQERASSFYDWFQREILQPRLRVDEHLADQVASQMVHLLQAACVGLPPAQARNELMVVQKVLPPAIRETSPIRSFLKAAGLHTVVRIGKLVFESERLYDAIDSAQRGGTASLYALDQLSEPVSLEFVSEDPPLLRVRHSPTVTDVEIFDKSWSALFEDGATRRGFLHQLRPMLGIGESAFDQLCTDLDMLPRFERMVMLGRKLASSVPLYYAWLFENVKSGTNVILSSLLPPDIPSLLEHARLLGDTRQFSERLSLAIRALQADYNIVVAFQTISALPVALPTAFLDALRVMSISERRNVIRSILRQLRFPNAVTNLVRVLLEFTEDSVSYRRLARVLSRWLTGKDAEIRATNFLHLAKWIENRCDDRLDAQSLSYEMRITAAWLHAAQLFQLLFINGLDFEQVTRSLVVGSGVAAGRPFEDLVGDVSAPQNVEVRPYMVASLGKALHATFAPSDIDWKSEVMRSISTIPTEPEVLHFELLGISEDYQNALGSYLGEDLKALLERYLPSELLEQLNPNSVLENIELVQRNPGELAGWALLGVRLGRNPIPARFTQSFRELFLSTDYATIYDKDDVTALVALKTTTDALFSLVDDGLRAYILQQLVNLGRLRKDRNAEEIHQLANFVVQRMLDVCRITGSPTRSARQFAAAIRDFALAYQVAWEPLRSIVEHLYRRLPFQEALELTPLIVLFRRR